MAMALIRARCRFADKVAGGLGRAHVVTIGCGKDRRPAGSDRLRRFSRQGKRKSELDMSQGL
jgi:hypothetical protein